MMTFGQSIQTCFTKYVDFNSRATRAEFWWFELFLLLGGFAIGFVGLGDTVVLGVFQLATLVPSLAVGTRRLHDIDKSGWWQLLWLIPVIGWIILIVWFCTKSDIVENRFGPPTTVI